MSDTKMAMFGHRGSSVSEPENTFSSIRKALEICDGAEFDVQMTKDGHLLVLHDETLARTAVAWTPNEKLSESEYYSLVNTPVTELNYDQLKDIHVGRSHKPYASVSKKSSEIESSVSSTSLLNVQEKADILDGQRLSSLPEVLELITKLHPSKQYLVEIKADISSVPLIRRDILASGATPQQVKFIGFSFETMVDIKRYLPAFSSVHLIKQKTSSDVLTAIYKASEAKLNGIDLLADSDTVTKEAVEAAHNLNLEVFVYVGTQFDTEIYWDKLQSNGVDVFTSDLPAPVFSWLEKNNEKGKRKLSPSDFEATNTPNKAGGLIKRFVTSVIEQTIEGPSCEVIDDIEAPTEHDLSEPEKKVPRM